jgi:hypothetical protein
LCKVYFPLPAKAHYIAGRLSRYITAPYESFVPRDKLGEFVSRAGDVIDFAGPTEFLDGVYPLPGRLFGSVYSFTRRIEVLEWVSFSVAIVAAFNMLLGLAYDEGAGQACWLNECPVAEAAAAALGQGIATANATEIQRQLRAGGSSSSGGGPPSSLEGSVPAERLTEGIWFPRSELHHGLGVAQLVCCSLLLLLTIVDRSPAAVHGHWHTFAQRYGMDMQPRHLADQGYRWLQAVLPPVLPPLLLLAYFGTLLVLRFPHLQVGERRSGCTLAALWLHSGCTLAALWLHSDYTLAAL